MGIHGIVVSAIQSCYARFNKDSSTEVFSFFYKWVIPAHGVKWMSNHGFIFIGFLPLIDIHDIKHVAKFQSHISTRSQDIFQCAQNVLGHWILSFLALHSLAGNLFNRC